MASSLRSRARSASLARLRSWAERSGYRLEPASEGLAIPPDFGPAEQALFRAVEPWTLTGPERVIALRDAVRHLVRRGVPGALVECGVYRGGSMLAVVHTLLGEGVTDRELYLFDTFTEVPDPGEHDVDLRGRHMRDHIDAMRAAADMPTPEQVRALLVDAGYPAERIHPVQGMVEDTVPAEAPEEIALLRLDTDWYSSTRHELAHLYHRVPTGGVVIIDDYGTFEGAKRATDEFLAGEPSPVLLHRVDFTARLIVR